MSARDLTALLALSALWGGSFLFIRVAVPVLGPLPLIELRVLIAGLALLAYALLTRSLPELRPHWGPLLVIGVINSALPFTLIATAELHLSASLAAVLNATTPLFGALVAALWNREQLTPGRITGLLLGLAGVALLIGLGPLRFTPTVAWSVGASLLAALSYGAAAVYIRRAAADIPPFALALYSQLFAALVLLPGLPFVWPGQLPTLPVTLSVLALALLCTALAYLLYFRLIQNVGALRATTVTYLSPAFGLLWGALILHERITPGGLLGFGLVLASVSLVTGNGRRAAQRPA